MAHHSKNAEIVQYEKQRQAMLKSKIMITVKKFHALLFYVGFYYKDKKIQSKPDSKAQLALLKEILYDDEQLKNLILKSDSTLKTVKDFFKSNDNETSILSQSNNKVLFKFFYTILNFQLD